MIDLDSRLTELEMSKPAFFVPGRIEVLGKHTDYAGGRSLLCAIERGILASVAPRNDSIVRVTDLSRQETREVPLTTSAVAPVGDWANYVATVARRVAKNFEARHGADIKLASNLPAASGMSSSTALIVAVFLALDAVNEFTRDLRYRAHIDSREALAAYLASVEMGGDFGSLSGDAGVGTFGGSEDHTAILCCQAEHLSRYSFIPTRHEGNIPFPADKTFVVAFCGIAAPKTGRALDSYNEASIAVRQIVELWNAKTGRSDKSLAAAVASGPDAADQIRDCIGRSNVTGFSSSRLRGRFDQFVLESDVIIPRASEALARGDFREFGDVVAESQMLAEAMLRNQIAETMLLPQLARDLGAHAASAFGGGFGGSVWALVNANDAEEFVTSWRTAFERRHPEHATHAEFFATRPGPSARSL